MINKPIEKIELSDFERLKDDAVAEGKTLEYKLKLPSNSDGDRKEFLADVSSFANASGGDLIFGIEEENGVPKKISGVGVENFDEEVRKYENIIRDGIEPRITFSTRAIPISKKKAIFIFRISKSWTGPHRVIFRDHGKFYSRNSAGKYPLDTGELKIAFTLGQTLSEQISRFKTERIAQIVAGNFPVPFYEGGKIIMHIVPLESFSPGYSINIEPVIKEPAKLRPIYCSGWNPRINLEGVLSYSGGRDDKAHSFTQLYRTGIVEGVEGLILSKDWESETKTIPSITYELELIRSLRAYLNLLRELGVNPPLIIFLTLTGIQGFEMGVDRMRFWGEHYKIDRDILVLPEAIVESHEEDAKEILRPMFDLVWNACGYKRSYNFDESGNWVAK